MLQHEHELVQLVNFKHSLAAYHQIGPAKKVRDDPVFIKPKNVTLLF